MYIRITTGTFDPAKEAELQQLTDEKYIPLLQQSPGFQSYLGGIDRLAGRVVAITVWDNMDHEQMARTAVGSLIREVEAAGLRLDPSLVFAVTREM